MSEIVTSRKMGATEPPRAIKPAFDARPHVQDPTGAVVAWLTEPPGAIIQFARPARGTTELARWLVGPATAALQRRFPIELRLVLVLDLTLMDGRDAGARALLHESAKDNKGRVARSFVIPPKKASATYLSALQVSATLLRVFGVRVEVESSLASVFASCPLRVAGP